MPLKRSSLELSVERELPEEPGSRARLSVRFDIPPGGPEPSAEELEGALRGLREELARAVGVPVAPPRAERTLGELIETYRPRQPELVELLREEGELTETEHALLRTHLARPGAASGPAGALSALPAGEPAGRPIAAAPLERDRTGPDARPVAELLSRYQIASLRQAGAVRARRQISYEEYMALKRHFAQAEAAAASAPGQ